MRASRSASSSQVFIARMTFSRGGIPCGKIAASSASRLTRAVVASRLAFDRVADAVERRPGGVPVDCVRVRVLARLRVRARDDLLPATPCAALRWAPSAAARENTRPHSGQVNWSADSLLAPPLSTFDWDFVAGLRARAIRSFLS
jgi:hypothetical protein